MKKIIIGLCFLLSSCSCKIINSSISKSYRKPKQIKIAILLSNKEKDFDCTDTFANDFINAGWKVIDRSVLEDIFKEQQLQMTGSVDENAVKIGKISGANLITSITYSRVTEGLKEAVYTMSCKVIDVETGEIIAVASCSGESIIKLPRCVSRELVDLINKK